MPEKIQLGRFKHVNSTDSDIHQKIELTTSKNQLHEYDIKTIVDVTELFDEERQAVNTYRLYGRIEYLSILNTLRLDYSEIEDFFTLPVEDNAKKTIYTDFRFYILKPSEEYTVITEDEKYVKNYEVISEVTDFELYEAGFDRNLFSEQKFAFNLNKDFDLSNYRDGLGFPVTDLYLFCQYQPTVNGNSEEETMTRKTYDVDGNIIITGYSAITLSVGDIIEGDIIEYNKKSFLQTTVEQQEFKITTQYSNNSSTRLMWKYNPIIQIKLREFSDDLEKLNINSNAVEEVDLIPEYAVAIDDEGNVVWRNLIDKGFIDPLTGKGLTYPFVNKKHYVFNDVVLKVVPDLDDVNTDTVFTYIKYGENELIRSTPTSSLDNLNKEC